MVIFTALRACCKPLFVWCLTLCLCSVVGAATQFVGPNNGDWSVSGNWSNGLPTSGNDALIGGGVTVVISQNILANFNLDCFGSLVVNAGVTVTNQGTFSLNSTSTWNGSLLNQANFNNYGAMTVNASVTNQSGVFYSNGTLVLSATSTMTNNATANLVGAVSVGNIYNNVAGSTGSNQLFEVLSGAVVTNQSGATFANNGGGTVTIKVGAAMNNLGIAQNGGTWNNEGSMTNSANFTNQVVFNNAGAVSNSGSAIFANPGTVNNNAGSITNAASATIQNGFRFNNSATVTNFGTFQNSNEVNNIGTATWNNEAGSAWSNNFGTVTTIAGTWNQKSTLSSDGSIVNNGTYTLTATINSNLGGTITNNATFNNNGVIANINSITNNGVWQNSGILNNNSGGSLFNNAGATFTNMATGKIDNNFEIRNKPLATFINNGIISNVVRLYNEGNFTNNAYVFNPGDVLNLAGGTFTNTEVVNLENGIFSNVGTLVNTKTFLISTCSELKNTGTINNTGGSIQNKGYINQLGAAVVGNAITNLGGYIKTTPGSAVAICNDFTAGIDQSGDAKVYAQSLVSITAIDSCSNFVYTANGIARPLFHCADLGTTQLVNLVIKDRLGDSLTCTSQVFVVDALEPQLASACPKDIYISTPTVPVAATWVAPTYIDNCTANPVVTVNFAPGSTFPVGITGVVYTAKDASLNASTICGFKVIVTQVGGTSNCTGNTAGPTFTSCPANITASTSTGSAVANWTQPTATDACMPVSITSNLLSGASFPVGTSTVTYTAKDGGNLTSTCTFTVTVNAINLCATDVFAPVLVNCPANIFAVTNPVTNNAVVLWNAPSASDNCTATVSSNYQPGTLFSGTTNVVYTATDAAGNTNTCTFTVLVNTVSPCPGDITAPTVTGCPANISLSTTTATAVATWTAPTFADNCAPITVNKTHNSGTAFAIGTTKVIYTASDKVGNLATCSFDVVVTSPCQNDAVNPVISGCPASINLTTTGTSATATWTAPTATDNCGIVSLMTTHQSGTTFPLGNTTVTYTATDLKGNAATCTFTVSVLLPPCAVTATASNIVCNDNSTPSNPADDTYTFNVTVTQNGYCTGGWTGGGKSGAYNVATAFGPYPISAGNQVLSFSAASGQSNTITITAPATCSNTPVCAITAVVSNVQCSNAGTASNPADDTYTFSVVVTQNGSCSGTWTGGGLTGVYGTATTFGPYLITGGNKAITFASSTGQTTIATATAPAACSTSSTTCTNNVLVNSGFETNTNFGWWNSNAGPTNTSAYSGLYSNCICNGDGYGAQEYPAYPGQTATFSLYAKKTGTPAWTGAGFDFLDVNGNYLGSGYSVSVNATNWTLYTVSGVAPAGTTSISVWFSFSGTTGCLLVDDLCLTLTGGTLPTCSGSTLTNPGFESGTTGWSLSNGATVGTSNIYAGLKSASACSNNSGGSQSISVVGGQVVNFMAYAKITGMPTGWSGVGIDFYDASWNWISGNSHTVLAPNYTLYALTATAPTNAAYCDAFFWKEGTAGCLYVDDLCLSAVATCSNITSAGTIGGAQTVYAGATPTALTNTTAPTGGSGNIEYIWLSSTSSCPTLISQAIAGATSATYQPSIPTQTTYFVRGARRAGCPNYVLSNCVTVTYSNTLCPLNLTFSNQSSCQIKVYWVNYSGNEVLYYTLNSWSSYIQGTYNTHQWRVRNAANGTLIGSYTAAGCSNQAYTTNNCGTACPTGGLTRNYFANQTTGDLNAVTWLTPTSTNTITSGQGPSNVAENYLTRVRGYIRPTVTGNYYLAITGDDATELWHSYTNQASGKQKVAYHSGWTNATELTKYSTQKSFAIWMEAGKDYYIELRHKEYTGGDHFGIWWLVPGASAYNIIPGVNLVPFTNCTNGNLLLAPDTDTEQAENLETGERTTEEVTTTRIDFGTDGLRLYPNPADQEINLDLSKFDTQPIIITIYDVIGRPIVRTQTNGAQDPFRIDLTNIVNGTYNIAVQPSGKRALTRTFIVTH